VPAASSQQPSASNAVIPARKADGTNSTPATAKAPAVAETPRATISKAATQQAALARITPAAVHADQRPEEVQGQPESQPAELRDGRGNVSPPAIVHPRPPDREPASQFADTPEWELVAWDLKDVDDVLSVGASCRALTRR
jgi:hypothetical protein